MEKTIAFGGAGGLLGYVLVQQDIQLITQDLGVTDPVIGLAVGAVGMIVVGMLMMDMEFGE